MARLGKDDVARGLAALRSAVLAVLAEERPALVGGPLRMRSALFFMPHPEEAAQRPSRRMTRARSA